MKTLVALAAASGLLTLLALAGSEATPTTTIDDNGAVLAQQYCQSCHVLPKPEDLDQATWLSKVFPMMRWSPVRG